MQIVSAVSLSNFPQYKLYRACPRLLGQGDDSPDPRSFSDHKDCQDIQRLEARCNCLAPRVEVGACDLGSFLVKAGLPLGMHTVRGIVASNAINTRWIMSWLPLFLILHAIPCYHKLWHSSTTDASPECAARKLH